MTTFEILEIFCRTIFYFSVGASPPHHPPGLRPWTPHAFGLRTQASLVSVWIRFAKISVSVLIRFAKISKSQTSPLSMSNTKSTISQKLKVAQKKALESCKQNNNSKYKNRKIDFSFVSAHCESFMKILPFLWGEGVCISLLGTGPYYHKIVSKYTHRKIDPESGEFKPKQDCNYTWLIYHLPEFLLLLNLSLISIISDSGSISLCDANVSVKMYTRIFFQNLIKSNQNQIIFTIFRLIWISKRMFVWCSKSIAAW